MTTRLIPLIATLVALALPAAAETRIPQSQAEITLGFAPLVKQAAPAVVNIYAKRVFAPRASPFSGHPFFEEFFKGFADPRPRVQNSLGSGVILSPDGIVVSNYHVVAQASDIRVVLSDRREYSAQVMLADEESDLALLRLEDAEGLPHLALRDSDRVEVGELVLAIGNPFGVGQTVSSGIVSGLARSGAATGQARGYFLQTDAPIELARANHWRAAHTRTESTDGGHHRVELALRRPGVADAHQHAPLHQQLRRGHCLRLLRTQRHHGHMVGKRCQPVELHRHDPRRIVGARGSPEEWPLQVHPGDRRAAFRRPVHRRPDAGQRRVVAGEGHRHQRRAPGGDALGQQQGVQPLPVRPVGAGHVHVLDPVDLEVDEAGREHPVRRRTRHRSDRLDLRDHCPVPRDPHGAAQPLGCQGEGAFHGRHPSTIS